METIKFWKKVNSIKTKKLPLQSTKDKEDTNKKETKKEEEDQNKKDDYPVLEEQGTTYIDVIRRIEQMDVEEYENSVDYKVVNLSAVEIPDEFISGGMTDAEVYRDEEEAEYLEINLEKVVLPDDDTVDQSIQHF